MLEYVIKRNGQQETADEEKLLRWSAWAAHGYEDRVNWNKIVKQCMRSRDRVLSTRALQQRLIKLCVRQKSWPFQIMAGRLYMADVIKDIFNNQMPTVKQQYDKLRAMNLVEEMPYTDEEFLALESAIDHKRDQELAYYQAKQLTKKYAIQLESTGQVFESPQFIFMRMAMALAMREERANWLSMAVEFYQYFSGGKISNPTPNYLNLGTGHRGYASCCLIAGGDDAESIGIANQIAYTLTYLSAGIGTILETRSIGDPVRGGKITHKGKAPYLAATAKEVKANTQGGRGGALTSYVSFYDPEIETLLMAQNPRTPAAQRNRDLHMAFKWNAFFAEAVAADKEVFVFNAFTAPDLHEAVDVASLEDFTALYNKYEADPNFKKVYINAQDIAYLYMQQRNEVSTNYDLQIDYVNHHTPHKERIRSSNLCVHGDTVILTKNGHQRIADLVDQDVVVWNGEEWSETTVRQTSEMSDLIEVRLSNGLSLTSTQYHKYYLSSDDTNKPFEIEARHLRPGMKLLDFDLPYIKGSDAIECIDEVPGGNVLDTHRIKWLQQLLPRMAAVLNYGSDEALALTSSKPEVMRGLVLMLQTLGVRSSITEIGNVNRVYVTPAEMKKLEGLGLDFSNVHTVEMQSAPDHSISVFVDSIVAASSAPTYCFTEPKRHMGVFNGILTGQCIEIMQPTKPYYDLQDLYRVDHDRGEVSMCSLAGVPIINIVSDEEYEQACYLALKAIDNAIHQANYKFPHIKYTATQRLNAGVGILGLATHLARKGLKYDTPEGLAEIHRVYERHMFFMIRASLRLGKELGNAPWMHKTKWPEGWMPIDTYNRNLDKIVAPVYQYDWEGLRAEVIANKGIRNSSLVAHMPTESSSKAVAAPNCAYPVRDLTLLKTDLKNALDWCAPDNDILENQYQLAWEIDPVDMMKVYGVICKFSDQGISADGYEDRQKKPKLYKSDLVRQFLARYVYGVKSTYYQNSFTETPTHFFGMDDDEDEELAEDDAGGRAPVCTSGGCTL